MKVLLLSHVPDDPDGGASRVYHLLADGLRGRGHQVTLTHQEDIGLPRDRRLGLLARRTVLPRLLSRAAAAWDPAGHDVVMASSGTAHPLFRRLRSEPRRPLLVNHVHGLTVHDHVAALVEAELGHHRSGPANRLLTGPFQVRWDLAGARSADVTVVQNLRDLGTLRELGDLDLALVPAAVHPELLRAAEGAPDPAQHEADHLLWFATWEARKGAYYVPAAFRAVRRERPGARLTVGGTGRPAEQVRAAFAPEDRDAVTVLGRVSREEHARLLGRAGVFLFPSLSEGFGLALPEAMAFGCAAVTTGTAFGGDHLSDGVDARVVPPTSEHLARAVLDLLGDDARRVRLATAGRALARTFTVERMLDGYEEVFTARAGRPGERAGGPTAGARA
ncbi:glycosyltransferase family 4 protein [Jannaschia sp. R86511]|uniref:glycosyltransferase family 4 protein n=1 Tax=Jannaschia sp. R86511 TaxID=3093853 RepID=UPI0036D2C355